VRAKKSFILYCPPPHPNLLSREEGVNSLELNNSHIRPLLQRYRQMSLRDYRSYAHGTLIAQDKDQAPYVPLPMYRVPMAELAHKPSGLPVLSVTRYYVAAKGISSCYPLSLVRSTAFPWRFLYFSLFDPDYNL
jgi:hypothetical protein